MDPAARFRAALARNNIRSIFPSPAKVASSKGPSRLLDLPGELRMIIWREVLYSHTGFIKAFPSEVFSDSASLQDFPSEVTEHDTCFKLDFNAVQPSETKYDKTTITYDKGELISLDILAVNKKTHHEASFIFWEENTFIFTPCDISMSPSLCNKQSDFVECINRGVRMVLYQGLDQKLHILPSQEPEQQMTLHMGPGERPYLQVLNTFLAKIKNVHFDIDIRRLERFTTRQSSEGFGERPRFLEATWAIMERMAKEGQLKNMTIKPIARLAIFEHINREVKADELIRDFDELFIPSKCDETMKGVNQTVLIDMDWEEVTKIEEYTGTSEDVTMASEDGTTTSEEDMTASEDGTTISEEDTTASEEDTITKQEMLKNEWLAKYGEWSPWYLLIIAESLAGLDGKSLINGEVCYENVDGLAHFRREAKGCPFKLLKLKKT